MVRGIFLDANLLLLLVIGTMERGLIARFKRTQAFSTHQFDSLVALISRADHVVTTPHVLTEVSSLANALHELQKQEFADTFALLITAMVEQYTPAKLLAADTLFRFGIADTSMLHLRDNVLLLSEDGRFRSLMISRGLNALNLHTASFISDTN